jgi:hypothetical protein
LGQIKAARRSSRAVRGYTSSAKSPCHCDIREADAEDGVRLSLNAVLEAEELPAGVAGLDTSLTDVDAQALTHVEEG